MARPSKCTPELVTELLGRLSSGLSMNKVCEASDMPDRATVFRWLTGDEAFRDLYARACEERREVRKEQLFDIPEREDLDPQRARLLSDNIKWVLAKEEPKKYGDKTTTELTGPDGGAIAFKSMDDDQLEAEIRRRIAASGLA